MPTFSKVSDDGLKTLKDAGGLTKETIRKRERAFGYFENFLTENGFPTVNEMAQNDVKLLGKALSTFFAGTKLVNGDLPKKNTVEA